jgi:hypothetical protein
MSLLSRLIRLEGRLPGMRGRKITQIVESVVVPNPIPNGAPIVEEIWRKDLVTGTLEAWFAPDLPAELPETTDAAAVERADQSSPFAFPSSG